MPKGLHLGSLWPPICQEKETLYGFGSQAHPRAAQRLTFECLLELFWRLLGWSLGTFEGIFFKDFLVYLEGALVHIGWIPLVFLGYSLGIS